MLGVSESGVRKISLFRQLFRVEDWLWSVLPLVYAAPLYYALFESSEAATTPVGAMKYLCFFVFVFAFLSFGYMINDYSDIEVDKACGKVKVIASMQRTTIMAIFVALVSLGVLPMILLADDRPLMVVILALTYFLGAIYSVSFIRAKERGIWGAVVSSFAQRGMPIAVAAVLFGMSWQSTLSWILLSFLNGLRYILIHQLLDFENDSIAKVSTLATQVGKRPLQIAINIILIVEIILLFPSVVWPCYSLYPLITVAIGFMYSVIAILLTLIHVRVFGEDDILYSYSLVPLEAFLNFLVPFAFSVFLSLNNYYFAIIGSLLLLMSCKALFEKLRPLQFVPQLVQNVKFYE